MTKMFFYGTLCHRPLLDLVVGEPRRLTVTPARLAGYEVLWAAGENHPLIRPAPEAFAEGLLVEGLSPLDIARLDYYEGGFAFDTRELAVEAEGRAVEALIYFPVAGQHRPGAPWSLSDWQAKWAEITLNAAVELMSYYGRVPIEEVDRLYPTIRMRAASRVRAGKPAPATLRADFGAEGLRVTRESRPHVGYFALDEQDLAFRRFDGTMSDTVTREGFSGGDAVTVLPYDPIRDRVMVIEQFRFGPHLRGDPRPWVLEPIAGRVDADETVETCAHREAMEEAGIVLSRLEHVADYYPSPGAVSEFLYSYIGIADLPDTAAGLGGVDHEAEDIRAHVISFDRLMELVSTGEAGCGPLVLSALWLAQNRARLRGSA